MLYGTSWATLGNLFKKNIRNMLRTWWEGIENLLQSYGTHWEHENQNFKCHTCPYPSSPPKEEIT
jgi:hypothetical protein